MGSFRLAEWDYQDNYHVHTGGGEGDILHHVSNRMLLVYSRFI